MRLNFKDVEEWEGGGPLAEGDYNIQVDEVIPKKAKSSGAKMWNITFHVIGSKRKVFENAMLEGKAFGKTKSLLKFLGFDVSKELDVDCEDLIGKKCGAYIGIDRQEGYDPRNKVVSYKQLVGDDMVDKGDVEFE